MEGRIAQHTLQLKVTRHFFTAPLTDTRSYEIHGEHNYRPASIYEPAILSQRRGRFLGGENWEEVKPGAKIKLSWTWGSDNTASIR